MKPNLKAGFEAWLELDGQYLFGKKEAELLEQIGRQGSFMRAAKTLGVSYAHAWNTIDRIQTMLGGPMVEARRGGTSGGGGAELTEEGVGMLKDYRKLQERLRSAVAGRALTKGERDIFRKEMEMPDLTVIGSNSVGISLIVEEMLREREFTYEVVSVGSSGGLNAVMLGEADIAGIHLMDPETREYNTPFLRRYWLAESAVLVRGYRRTQGLIVRKGNPKRITDFRDLLRRDIRIVNRSLGSGTRQILDTNLQRIADEDQTDVKRLIKRIRGYSFEVDSHVEVAEAVEKGEADVGVGVEVRTVRRQFESIPLQEEWFDFVIKESRLKKPLVELFLKVLRSERLREASRIRVPEIRFTEETGRIVHRP